MQRYLMTVVLLAALCRTVAGYGEQSDGCIREAGTGFNPARTVAG